MAINRTILTYSYRPGMRHQAHQWTLDGDQWSFHYSNRAAAVQSPSTSFSQTSFSPATISPLKSYVGNSFNPNDKTTNKTPYHSALRSHAGNSWKPSNTKTDPISTTPVLGSCAGNSWVSTRDRPKPKCSILAPERQSCNAPIPLFQQETLHQIREQTASSTPALSGTTNDYPKTCPSSTSLSSNALSRWAQYVDVDDIEVLPCSPSNQTTSSRADTILSPSTTVSSNSSFSTSSIESSRSFHSTESSSSLWASRQLLGRKPNQGASFQLSSLQRQNGTTEARNESAAYPTLTDCKSEASSKQKHTTGPSRHPRRSQASESFQPPSLFREFKSPRGLLVQQLVGEFNQGYIELASARTHVSCRCYLSSCDIDLAGVGCYESFPHPSHTSAALHLRNFETLSDQLFHPAVDSLVPGTDKAFGNGSSNMVATRRYLHPLPCTAGAKFT